MILPEYITVNCSGTFLKNAGIIGFIRFLRINGAENGKDYVINGNELSISTDYLINNDIAQMYFDTITDVFEKRTKFYRIITSDREKISRYYEKGAEKLDKSEIKALEELYKAFETEMSKNSYSKAFGLIKSGSLSDVSPDDIKILKKEKDLNAKYAKYTEIADKISEERVKKQFIYTTLLYGDFRYFFNENKTSHVIPALDDPKKSRRDTIYDKFFKGLAEDISADEKKKKNCCIECMRKTSVTVDNSFMVDTADDLGKKKSYYWNLKPDAYLCPVCAMLYLFVPLGFVLLGKTAVFVNMNTSINTMYRYMETYREKALGDENQSYYKRLYSLFTDEKIRILSNSLSNIQIIFKEDSSEHYNMKIIDKNIIEKLTKANKNGSLGKIENVSLKFGENYVRIYDEVFKYIFAFRSMYELIDKCLKYEFSNDSKRYWYIFSILKTEIIFNGGNEVEKLEKQVNIAFNAGKEMRNHILGSNNDENDNSMRGYVYRLINLSSVGDISQFIDTVLRQYSGYGMSIPRIFTECYKSEESFKAIAHSYILGLKYCTQNENNETGESKNE